MCIRDRVAVGAEGAGGAEGSGGGSEGSGSGAVGYDLFRIGDAVSSRTIHSAILDALRLGLLI